MKKNIEKSAIVANIVAATCMGCVDQTKEQIQEVIGENHITNNVQDVVNTNDHEGMDVFVLDDLRSDQKDSLIQKESVDKDDSHIKQTGLTPSRENTMGRYIEKFEIRDGESFIFSLDELNKSPMNMSEIRHTPSAIFGKKQRKRVVKLNMKKNLTEKEIDAMGNQNIQRLIEKGIFDTRIKIPLIEDGLGSFFDEKLSDFTERNPHILGKQNCADPSLIVIAETPEGDDALAYYIDGELYLSTYVSPGGYPNHQTPTGVRYIMQKDADKKSRTYNNAPMARGMRLQEDGIRMHHSNNVDGGNRYHSHGCIRLPMTAAKEIYRTTLSLYQMKNQQNIVESIPFYKNEPLESIVKRTTDSLQDDLSSRYRRSAEYRVSQSGGTGMRYVTKDEQTGTIDTLKISQSNAMSWTSGKNIYGTKVIIANNLYTKEKGKKR